MDIRDASGKIEVWTGVWGWVGVVQPGPADGWITLHQAQQLVVMDPSWRAEHNTVRPVGTIALQISNIECWRSL